MGKTFRFRKTASLLAVAFLFLSAFFLWRIRDSQEAAFLKPEKKIIKIEVLYPGMPGSVDRQSIKTVTAPGEIKKLVEYANKPASHLSNWKKVDSSLTAPALIRLDYITVEGIAGRLGFSADFHNAISYRDQYGTGGTYLEMYSADGHYKRDASSSEIQEMLSLLEISKDDYDEIEKSWRQGRPWKPKT